MRRTMLTLLALLLLPTFGFGQATLLQQGEAMFLDNKPEEALPLLQTALRQYPNNEVVYLYLGMVYEQLGWYEEAVLILQRGSEIARDHQDAMYYNMGNSLFVQGKNSFAVEMYSRAVETNPEMADAYLNRANARLKLEFYAGALDDYSLYLSMRPMSPQREAIEKVMAILREMVEEETARERAEEEGRLAEEARQKALLDEVLNSLERAGQGTKNLSAESEDIEEVREETDIVD